MERHGLVCRRVWHVWPGYALAIDESQRVYAGGGFQNLAEMPSVYQKGAVMNNVAIWDGSAWSPMGSGIET